MTSSSLYRLTALAGVASAVVLVFNFLRRAGVVPDLAITQALAPLSATFGLVAVTGLFLWHRREGRIGAAGTAAYAANLFGLTGVLGIEYIANVVFPRLDEAVVDQLVAGPPGTVFLVISVVFLLGVLAFTGVLLTGGLVPWAAAALYGAGFAAIALRTLLPEALVGVGGFAAAAGLAAMSLTLYRNAGESRCCPGHGAPAQTLRQDAPKRAVPASKFASLQHPTPMITSIAPSTAGWTPPRWYPVGRPV